jgi:hypothetical protein
MNIEEIENKFLDKEMIIKFLEANRQNKYGFIEMDCRSVCVLLDYINQLETNRDEAINIIKNHIDCEETLDGMLRFPTKKIIDVLERGKEY